MTMGSSRRSEEAGTANVLIIDDDPVFRRVLAAILEEEPPGALNARMVETGGAALGMLRATTRDDADWRPDLVVLDYRLPDMQAPTILRYMRSATRLNEVPVLVLTQARWEQDEAAAMAAGATLFREKPSSVAELREIVVSCLAGRSTRNVTPPPAAPSRRPLPLSGRTAAT